MNNNMIKPGHGQSNKDKNTLKYLAMYFGCTIPHLLEVTLDKLLYIAHLYHYSNHGRLMSNTRFFSLSYGPHAPATRSIVKELIESNDIYLRESRTSKDPVYSNPCLIIKPYEHKDKKLSILYLDTLREVEEEWKDRNFTDILDYTARTIPFLSTPYRMQIDMTLVQPFRDLKQVLSLSQRRQIHQFVEQPEVVVDQDIPCRTSVSVSINEIAEIYLTLCENPTEKITSQACLGFNPQAVLNALGSLNDNCENGTEKYSTDIDRAARLASSLFDSMSFRNYSGRVALITGMLFLSRSGYFFNGKALEGSWPQGNSYDTIREWFHSVCLKAGNN